MAGPEWDTLTPADQIVQALVEDCRDEAQARRVHDLILGGMMTLLGLALVALAWIGLQLWLGTPAPCPLR